MLFLNQSGYESMLEEELRPWGAAVTERGSGWVWSRAHSRPPIEELCFAHAWLLNPVEITGDSVNQLAGRIVDWFLPSIRDERMGEAWPCLFQFAAEIDGLGRRVSGVEEAFNESLKKRMGRVARLASTDAPRGPAVARGLFVYFVDFRRAFVARECRFGGQRRMADDPLAPSRSYLKVEEAYGVLGREPKAGETVVDLGAAPGGWSYSAAKRQARVIAVDNGPLKAGASDNPRIEHRREDAFKFRPRPAPVDWLFCDLVEDPHHVVDNLIRPWLANKWCRRFVVNLKFGRVAAVPLLREMRAPDSPFVRHATQLRIRHLYHDREELTLVGEVQP